MRMMRCKGIETALVLTLIAVTGCNTGKPFIAVGQAPPPQAAPAGAAAASTGDLSPATSTAEPVATSALGTVSAAPGLTPAPKPFVALPKITQASPAIPSTLLLEHAVPDSPVPLSDYAKQPVYTLSAFKLRSTLSAAEVQRKMGLPAQLADNADPWLVYRLDFNRELWLHFAGPYQDRLDAADVVRGAEDGYVRERVFSADDGR